MNMSNTVKKLDIYIRKSEQIGMLHDSRNDVRTLAKVLNVLIDKVNELIDAYNSNNQSHEPE